MWPSILTKFGIRVPEMRKGENSASPPLSKVPLTVELRFSEGKEIETSLSYSYLLIFTTEYVLSRCSL